MSTSSRHLSLGTSILLCAGCFSPTGQSASASASEPTVATTDPTTGATTTTTDPTGGETTSLSPSTSAPSTTDAPSTTAPTTGGPCGVCLSPTPYCVATGDCVGCLALADHGLSCGALDPAKTYCDQDGEFGSGECVACLSTSDCDIGVCHPELKACVECIDSCPDSGVCDPDTHTCKNSCDEHSDCPETACELDTHVCFPAGETVHWYVQAQDPCLDAPCTEGAPCCEIADPFAKLGTDKNIHHVIHVGPGSYINPLTLTVGSKRVAILAAPDAILSGPDNHTKPIIEIGGGADPVETRIYISGLRITGTGSHALSCHKAQVAWLDDVQIVDAVGGALHTSHCTLHARRSQFLRNLGGLDVGEAGHADIENSIFSGVTKAPNLSVLDDGRIDLNYTTVALQTQVESGLIHCEGVAGVVNVRNSALLAADLELNVTCLGGLAVDRTAVTQADLLGQGDDNVLIVDPHLPFVDWSSSDLHLLGDGGALKNVAQWDPGDPTTDIEGALRPNIPGALDVAGADRSGP